MPYLSHPTETMDALYDAAVHYVSDLGWKIVPTDIHSKIPLVAWKSKTYTVDDIDEWFDVGVRMKNGSRVKYFNLALVTGDPSSIVVVDADNEEAVRRLEAMSIHSALTVKTKKGKHLYFRHPGFNVANVNGDFQGIDGCDVRGDGGIAILPPSVRYDENGDNPFTYTWDSQLSISELMEYVPSWADLKLKNMAGIDLTGEAPDNAGDQIFANLDLSKIKIRRNGTWSVWDETAERVAEKGKLKDGDGRNFLMVRFAGQMVRTYRKYGKELHDSMRKFEEEFFEYHLDKGEFEKIKKSAVTMDQRKFPHDYDDQGNRIQPQKYDKTSLFSVDSMKDLRARVGATRYLINPFLRERQITMVYGYTGHGKSNFTLATLFAAAAGKSWGPFDLWSTPKTLYFDFENGLTTILDRMEDLQQAFGTPGQNLMMWDRMASNGAEDLNLRQPDGVSRLFSIIEDQAPDVVVIDTARSAWVGLEENNAREWADVNRVLRHIRDVLGCAVILIHHSNKPRMDENGRIIGGTESGSTAQLNDVETQVRVTLCVEDEQTAFSKRAKSGAAKTPSEIGIAENEIDQAFAKLRRQLRRPDDNLMFVYEISYEKVRIPTSNHATVYVGAVEDADGSFYWVGTDSPRQRVIKASKLGLSYQEIQQFLGRAGERVVVNGRGYVNSDPLTLGIKQIKGWLQSEEKRENTT